MVRNAIFAALMAAVIGGAFVILRLPRDNAPCAQHVVFPGKDISFCVEVAADSAALQQGLVGRETLREGQGMLFVFPGSQPQPTFTMAGMHFPLDIIFFDEERRVVFIAQDLPPCPDWQHCVSVTPPAPAQYVLEVNAGTAKASGIEVGMVAEFLQQ